MKIGIDASRSQDMIQKTGVEHISDSLVRGLAERLSTEHDVYLYTPSRIDSIAHGSQKIMPFPRLWTVVRLSLELIINRPDIYFSPVHELPFFCPKNTYRLVHDVAFLKRGKSYSLFQKLYMRFGIWRSVKVCKKIFVPTEAVKRDLLEYTDAREDQVVAIGFGFDRKNKDNTKYANKNQFVFVGRVEDKKNLINVIKGFEIFSNNTPGYTLVIAGKPGHGYHEIEEVVNSSDSDIKLMGYIDDQYKDELQQSATAVLLISREEGFGIPILEGFDWGSVVIAADIPHLREIGGDACIYVKPHSPEAIAYTLGVSTDPEVQDSYPDKGFRQIRHFHWNIVYQNIIDTFFS
ncbi:MAG: glycosyltransferase family 4 protein [Patescibacteria group bacterium]